MLTQKPPLHLQECSGGFVCEALIARREEGCYPEKKQKQEALS